MTDAQRLTIKASEQRQRLNELAGIEELTDDAPSTVSSGAVGGVETVQATVNIWVSRPAADDAAGAAVALAGELARLRHRLAALDVDDDGLVNVQPTIRTDIRPRGPEAVTVVGRVVVTFDYEATAENP